MGISRAFVGKLPLPRPTQWALALAAPWALHGFVATIFGAIGIAPIASAAAVASVGLAALLFPSSHSELPPEGRWPNFMALLALTLPAVVLVAPPYLGWSSDVYAHVAAVRACLEEAAVFPAHEFYLESESGGPDPRFGTGHAFYAVWATLARVTPLMAWHVFTAAGVLLHLVIAGGLATALFRNNIARFIVTIGFTAAFGGAFYNVLEVAAFPLWVGFPLVLAILMLESSEAIPQRRRDAAIGLLIGGAAGLHIFAFIIAVMILGSHLAVLHFSDRKLMLARMCKILAIAAPIIALRLAISYGDVNPVHQRPWATMEWGAGWYSASPSYLLKWWFPFAFMGIWLAPFMISKAKPPAIRTSALLALMSCIWLGVPYLLTVSMRFLGFLPLRFTMLVLFPILLAAYVDDSRWRQTRQNWIAGAVALALIGAMISRGHKLFAHEAEPLARSGEWANLVESLVEDLDETDVVVSDPLSMMLVRASAPPRVMAVPTGRSSPRDPRPLERIQDAWAIMSPSTSAAETDSLVKLHKVTHVLLNHRFTEMIYLEQYPVAPIAFDEQRRKFLTSSVQRVVYDHDGLTLLELDDSQDYYAQSPESCFVAADLSAEFVPLADGFRLSEVSLELDERSRKLRIRASLLPPVSGDSQDRFFVLRADREQSVVPSGLRFAEKPYRKAWERLTGRIVRQRWTEFPASGACPTHALQAGQKLPLQLDLDLSDRLAPGSYNLSFQVATEAGFTDVRLVDFLRNDDIYQGPIVGSFEVVDSATARSPEH